MKMRIHSKLLTRTTGIILKWQKNEVAYWNKINKIFKKKKILIFKAEALKKKDDTKTYYLLAKLWYWCQGHLVL